MAERKKLKDTKIGGWIREKAPDLLEIVGDVLPDSGTLGVVKNLIDREPDLTPEEKAAADLLMKEMYSLEVADRDSARKREAEVKKTGSQDWMMSVTGIIGLASFVFLIYAVVYIPEIADNKLFVHLMGMVEGVVITNIFAYYYGTSAENRK